MKRRTIIVDLDCPFGINHFDLIPCDDCLEHDLSTIPIPMASPPFAPVTTQTFEWTTIGSSTTDASWTNISGGPITSPVYKIELGNDTDTKTFDITNVTIT